MLNFISSELYKIVHRRCLYVFAIIFMGSGFLLNGLIRISMDSDVNLPAGEVLGLWQEIAVIFGWFIVFMVAQIVHSNESKAGVLKNSISFGYNRMTVYVGRFVTQFIVLVLALAAIAGMILLGIVVFFGAIPSAYLLEFIKSMGLVFILWVAALAMANCFLMNFPSGSLATVTYILYFVLVEQFISIASELLPNNHIVTFLLNYEIFCIVLRAYTSDNPLALANEIVLVGITYFVVFFFGGLFLIRRKEVK